MTEKEKKSGIVGQVMADWLNLPEDVVLDLPKIILLGRNEVKIENHRGLIECADSRMRINLARGFLEICGKELQIRSLCAEDISLVGQVDQVSFWE